MTRRPPRSGSRAATGTLTLLAALAPTLLLATGVSLPLAARTQIAAAGERQRSGARSAEILAARQAARRGELPHCRLQQPWRWRLPSRAAPPGGRDRLRRRAVAGHAGLRAHARAQPRAGDLLHDRAPAQHGIPLHTAARAARRRRARRSHLHPPRPHAQRRRLRPAAPDDRRDPLADRLHALRLPAALRRLRHLGGGDRAVSGSRDGHGTSIRATGRTPAPAPSSSASSRRCNPARSSSPTMEAARGCRRSPPIRGSSPRFARGAAAWSRFPTCSASGRCTSCIQLCEGIGVPRSALPRDAMVQRAPMIPARHACVE